MMTKEQFLYIKENKESIIRQAMEDIEVARNTYLYDNRPARVGDEILVEGQPAIVRSIVIDHEDNVIIGKISRKKQDGNWAITEQYAYGDVTDLKGRSLKP